MRRENEVFTDPQTAVDFWLNDINGRKRIKLTHPSMSVIIIGNFDVVNRDINPSFYYAGWWYDYFSGDSIYVSNGTDNISLLPGEFHIYTNRRLDPPEPGILNSVEIENPLQIVELFELSQNFPNPFNPSTTIIYKLPHRSSVSIKVYDAAGVEISVLVDEYAKLKYH